MSSETPRTCLLEGGRYGRVKLLKVDGTIKEGSLVDFIERAPVDAERERMLDVIKGLFEAVGITNLIASTVPEIQEAEAILREYDRLPKEGS